MTFPQRRLRRLRRTPALRRLVAETRLSVDDLIAPLFVREGIELNVRQDGRGDVDLDLDGDRDSAAETEVDF